MSRKIFLKSRKNALLKKMETCASFKQGEEKERLGDYTNLNSMQRFHKSEKGNQILEEIVLKKLNCTQCQNTASHRKIAGVNNE